MQVKDIFDYVYRMSNDIDTIKKYINGLLDKTEVLRKYPFIGQQLILIDNIITQYRYLNYKNHLIFYRVDEEKIYIDRILNLKLDYVKEFIKEI